MRLAAATLLVLAAATPAAAQDLFVRPSSAAVQAQLNQLELQAQAARQREISTHNQMMALDSRLRAEQGLADVRSQAYIPRLPPVTAYQAVPAAPLPAIDTTQLADIPDSALADSDRRVREASQNRR